MLFVVMGNRKMKEFPGKVTCCEHLQDRGLPPSPAILKARNELPKQQNRKHSSPAKLCKLNIDNSKKFRVPAAQLFSRHSTTPLDAFAPGKELILVSLYFY
ncbi:MAG: hypothetical protein PHI97_07740 [Desulfobulbus sp.]|nr:hypothetical protein [Desulfobulbus sp.]